MSEKGRPRIDLAALKRLGRDDVQQVLTGEEALPTEKKKKKTKQHPPRRLPSMQPPPDYKPSSGEDPTYPTGTQMVTITVLVGGIPTEIKVPASEHDRPGERTLPTRGTRRHKTINRDERNTEKGNRIRGR